MTQQGYSVFLPQFVYIAGNKALFKEESSYYHFENITQFVLYEQEHENKHGYELFLLKRNDGQFIELALDAAPDLSMCS